MRRRVLVGVGISLAGIFFLGAGRSLAKADWSRLSPASQGFAVSMPSPPERTITATPSFVGKVENVQYETRQGKEVFIVNRVDLPRIATLFMSDSSLLAKVREEYISQGEAREVAYRDAKRDGRSGKALDFVRAEGTDKSEDGYAEFFVVDGKLYTFTGLVPHGHDTTDVKRYLASIDFHDD